MKQVSSHECVKIRSSQRPPRVSVVQCGSSECSCSMSITALQSLRLHQKLQYVLYISTGIHQPPTAIQIHTFIGECITHCWHKHHTNSLMLLWESSTWQSAAPSLTAFDSSNSHSPENIILVLYTHLLFTYILMCCPKVYRQFLYSLGVKSKLIPWGKYVVITSRLNLSSKSDILKFECELCL